jgi:hypothetical protein
MFTEVHGFEDLATFDGGGLIAVASDHGHFRMQPGYSMRQMLQEKQRTANALDAVDIRGYWAGTWHHLDLSEATPSDFYPHGLAGRGSLENSGEGATLLVVNHRSTHDSLERFSVQGTRLVHEQTVAHPLMINLNDCVLLSDADVLCTNWRSYETGSLADMAEMYGQQPWSYVIHCELSEGTCTKVASGIRMANGIEARGDYAFVVSSLDPSLHVYRMYREGGYRLELVRKIATQGACDNLVWGGGDSLLSGCHPKALTFVRYSKNPKAHSAPCEVLQFDGVMNETSAAAQRLPTAVYVDSTGTELSACSVAAKVGGELWIGAVHDHGLLKCKI